MITVETVKARPDCKALELLPSGVYHCTDSRDREAYGSLEFVDQWLEDGREYDAARAPSPVPSLEADGFGGVTLKGPDGRSVYFQPGDDAAVALEAMDAPGTPEAAAWRLWDDYEQVAA